MQSKHIGAAIRATLDRLVEPDADRADIPARVFVWGAVLIGLLAAGLRLWNIGGASIWMDEAVTLGLSRLPVETILFARIDNHPPLSFLIQHAWLAMVPDVSWARVPSAVFGSLTVITLIGLLRDQVSRRAALVGGVLLAFSTANIYYSQDLRMYAVLMLGLMLATWGAMGLASPRRCSLRTYSGLYVLGAAIAIYSHAIGLVCMALIGGASLVAGFLSDRGWNSVRRWFACNVVVFVIALPWLAQIPGASTSFGGLGASVSVLDIHWFYRNAIGYPGLGDLGPVFDMLAIVVAGAAILLALWYRRWTLAFMLVALVIVFPIMIGGLHLRQSILSTRTLLPAAIGVAIALGYGLSVLRDRRLRYAATGIFVAAAAASSLIELSTRTKLEDNRAALAFANAQGFAAAPVLACHAYTAAAIWEEAPDRVIYYDDPTALLHYKGPDYWRAASRSMSVMRQMSQAEIDAFLGGGWLVEGGLEALLSAQSQVVTIRSYCTKADMDRIAQGLADAGFQRMGQLDLRASPDQDIVIETPQTVAELFRKVP